MGRRRRSVAVAVATSLALVLAACSGSDDAPSDGGSTTAAAGASTTTTVAASTGPGAGGMGAGADEWATVTPDEAGLDGDVLDDIAADAEANESNCLLVARHGRIAGEWYFNDTDETSGQEVFSATKSFTSILVGIAADDGDLDLADSASTFIPEWKGTDAEAVTVRHLLSNDSGRSWSLAQDYGELVTVQDKTQFGIDLPQERAPGEVWAYNNAAIQTLDQVIEDATGTPMADFGQERLLDPIGMADSAFTTDGAGNTLAFMGLRSTCRDMARFGQLLLQDGTWNGEQIVSKDFLDEATTSSQELNEAYGYLIWLNRKGTIAGAVSPVDAQMKAGQEDAQIVPGAPEDLFWAQGLGGQVIQVDRATDTVVVRLGSASVAPTFGSADTARVVTEAIQD